MGRTDREGSTERGPPVAFKKVIPVEDAIALIRQGDVLATAGYGGNGTPEALLLALERRFLETGGPGNLTLVYAGGQGEQERLRRAVAAVAGRPQHIALLNQRDGLFMSGYPAEGLAHQGKLGEDIPLLSKPFRKVELAHWVREELDRE